ncbi:hypothetical protein NUU61_002772 [Penicillium alfredii]|uniref:DUF1742-domain-containing protein n=1 Tax=Penicillium alfredii TaxID=1506179 RepID=A0A9W9FSV8_9EURO|nr:uncharacterized protein NUU61_002772 [Penicillium alfredii]KAJ5105425.1 hypothetical protein NUU61_002772 [Penicillium alfredii]
MSLTNVYHLRRVADTSAKACFICYKPSTSVLITPDNKDFFYVCLAHLQDRHFCSPIVDTEGQAARAKEEAMAQEIEKVKKEYEEKQRRKKEREKESNKDDNNKDKDTEKEKENEKTDKEKTKEADATGFKSTEEKERDDKMRIDRLRNIEMAKRNQERFKNPSLFPSAPSGDL